MKTCVVGAGYVGLVTAACLAETGNDVTCVDRDADKIRSDGSGLLLRQVERRTGIIQPFAACSTDHRGAALTEHTVEALIAQRLYGLALGDVAGLYT